MYSYMDLYLSYRVDRKLINWVLVCTILFIMNYTQQYIYIIFFFIPDLTSAYKLSSIEAFNHSVTVKNWTEMTVYYAVTPMVKATIETIFRCVKERKGGFTLYNT